jgi:hypothetical protein
MIIVGELLYLILGRKMAVPRIGRKKNEFYSTEIFQFKISSRLFTICQ